MRNYLLLLLLVSFSTLSAQNDSISKHGFYIPRNIDECNRELDKILTNKVKKD